MARYATLLNRTVDASHMSDAEAPMRFGEALDAFPEPCRVLDERRDIPEQDARLRVVGNRADESLEVERHGGELWNDGEHDQNCALRWM